ncbi:MAG: cation diffusion facilitator family transporter [Bacteroidales bacterium]|jgi:cation diffusion facilitator family transporter|nr:cation diffusion facilitator family transporter [Bacteroidales bacterium]
MSIWIDTKTRERDAVKITMTGFIVNFSLSIFKVIAGIAGRSGAMLADGLHSFSDFITDLIVIIFIKISSRGKDRNHNYGHGKFETMATSLISLLLIGAGLFLFIGGISKIINVINGSEIVKPRYIALIAAAVSIIAKEWLYRITEKKGREIKSEAVIANGWHHRSDAFSSAGTFIGIGGAMLLGKKWSILDPLAAIIVSIFIIITGLKLLIPALQELLETALPEEIEKEIGEVIMSVKGVKNFHRLSTRKSGRFYIIDVHIKVDPALTIVKAHDISSHVETALNEKYEGNTETFIHVEPYYENQDI